MRRATLADINDIISLEIAFPPSDRFSRRNWRTLLTGKAEVLVEDAVHRAGLSCAVVLLFRSNSKVARIYSLVVAPDCRGQGLAKRLLDACAHRARERGCARLRLEVRTTNAAAISLYEQAGFNVFAKRFAYYADGAPAWRMEKELDMIESPAA